MFRFAAAFSLLGLLMAPGTVANAQLVLSSNVRPSATPAPIFLIDSDPASPTFNSVTATVDNNQLHSANAMAFSPDGTFAYVNSDDPFVGGVEVVNLLFNSVDGFIDTGFGTNQGSTYMDVGPDGTGYVAGFAAGNPHVAAIDMLDRNLITTIALDGSPSPTPSAVAVRPDGGVVYVLVDSLSSVARILVISADTDQVVAVIPVPRGSRKIAFRPDGAYAYVGSISDVCGASASNVQIIDAVAHQVVGEVPQTSCANDIAFSPDGADAYITYYNPPGSLGVVQQIDTGTGTVINTIALPNTLNTYGITVSSVGYVYVEAVNQDFTASVFVIYTLNDQVVGSVSGLPSSAFPGLMKAM